MARSPFPRPLKILQLLGCGALGLLANTPSSFADVLYLLDASGSMRQITGGERQIDSARSALIASLQQMPVGTPVGLRVYAHRENQADKNKSCIDSELVVPISPDSGFKIATTLSGIDPKGYTPIAFSLEQARSDFALAKEGQKTIVLLSDGEETCGGDPAGVIRKLRADGFDVKVHVVGFNVGGLAEKQLRDVAAAGGGEYFSAKDPKALAEAMQQATQAATVIQKDKAVYGKEVQGGNAFESAAPINLDTEYRLNHHQKKNDYDYFYVDLQPGQEVSVKLKTLEKGVAVSADGKARETEYPYAGVSINSPERARLAYRDLIGAKFAEADVVAAAGRAGKYYILLGSSYEAMNKDHVTFTVSRKVNGDLGGDLDAGDTEAAALGIEAKRYPTSFLGGPDKRDVYSFQGKKGDTFLVGFIPGKGLDAFIGVLVYDEFKERYVEKSFPKGQGGRSERFTLREDGTYYVDFSMQYDEELVGSYAFELKRVEAEVSQPTPAAQ